MSAFHESFSPRGSTMEPPYARPSMDTSDSRIHRDSRFSTNGQSRHSSHHLSLPLGHNPYHSGSPTPFIEEPVNAILTPAANARGPAELEDNDAEYMTVAIQDTQAPSGDDAYYGSSSPAAGSSSQAGSRGRKFVGGFVANLKRLPRAMVRNVVWDRSQTGRGFSERRDHQQWRQPLAWGTMSGQQVAPPYGSPEGQPVGDSVLYVEALDMPTEHPAPPPSSFAPSPSRDTKHGPRLSPHRRDTQRSPSHLSASGQLSSQRSSVRRISRTSAPTVRNPDPESDSDHSGSSSLDATPEPPHIDITPPHDTGVHFEVRSEHHPGSRTGPDNMEPNTPVLVEPKPAPDYARMQSPIEPPAEPSFPSQLARIQRFFRDLGELPWVPTESITVEFVPRIRRTDASTPWYTPRHGPIDLLAGGTSSTRHLAAASGQTLAPGASSATLLHPSSSYGHGQGQGPPPQFIYSMSPIPPPPPPLYMYPAYPASIQPLSPPSGPPRTTDPDTSGTTGISSNSSPPQQGYPLYVLAMPPTTYFSPSNPVVFPPGHGSARPNAPT